MKHKITYIILICLLVLFGFLIWKPTKPHKLSFRKVAFEHLPGWVTTDTKKSLRAFQLSCKAFLNQPPNKSVGSQFINLQAKDWHPACKAASLVDSTSNKDTKAFFQA